jgi:hypothetical protein
MPNLKRSLDEAGSSEVPLSLNNSRALVLTTGSVSTGVSSKVRAVTGPDQQLLDQVSFTVVSTCLFGANMDSSGANS